MTIGRLAQPSLTITALHVCQSICNFIGTGKARTTRIAHAGYGSDSFGPEKDGGASFWPRIGQEVIVDFLEGDPDQPIIVGGVYNAEQMPPR
jgi:hypothetical protein